MARCKVLQLVSVPELMISRVFSAANRILSARPSCQNTSGSSEVGLQPPSLLPLPAADVSLARGGL